MKPWVSFAGGVLVVAVLYWAQAVLVPFALAILLTFVLAPPVTWLQRWVGRVAAVLLVVTLVFAALGFAAWGLTWQLDPFQTPFPILRTLRVLTGPPLTAVARLELAARSHFSVSRTVLGRRASGR